MNSTQQYRLHVHLYSRYLKADETDTRYQLSCIVGAAVYAR